MVAKNTEAKAKLKTTILRARPELLQRAKIAAVKRNMTLQALLNEALESYLKGVRS
jgi:hypothetical protein